MWLGRERGERRDTGREVVSVEPDCRALKLLPLTSRAPAAKHPTYLLLIGSQQPCQWLYKGEPI